MELVLFDPRKPRLVAGPRCPDNPDRKQQRGEVCGAASGRQPADFAELELEGLQGPSDAQLHADDVAQEPAEIELVHAVEEVRRQAEERRGHRQREGHPAEAGVFVQEEQQAFE